MKTKLIKKLNNSEYSDLVKSTPKYLKKYAKLSDEFLMKNYGLELTIPLKLRTSNSSILGKLRILEYCNSKRVAKDIILNRVLLISAIASNDFTNFEKVLKHELIHYALFMSGKEFRDGTELFEKELDKYDSVHSSTVTSNCLLTPYILDNYVDDSNSEHLFKHKENNPVNYFSMGFVNDKLTSIKYVKRGVNIYA